MGGFSSHNLAFAFGLLGNIISFFVFLSPIKNQPKGSNRFLT
ncbi:hypothetical protein CsSME_00040100 [Camellia sinensis var. sinensis]